MTIIFITLAGERIETSDVQEVRRRAANGEITPDTIINVDGTPHLASRVKGIVFGTSANETPSTPSVPPEAGVFLRTSRRRGKCGVLCAVARLLFG